MIVSVQACGAVLLVASLATDSTLDDSLRACNVTIYLLSADRKVLEKCLKN